MENLLEQIVKTRMKHAFGNANTIGKDTPTGKMFIGKGELLESILEEWEGMKAQASESNCNLAVVSGSLPSDIDINRDAWEHYQMKSPVNEKGLKFKMYCEFVNGAKWMRDLIEGQ